MGLVRSVLLVDDDPRIARATKRLVQNVALKIGHTTTIVDFAESWAEAKALIARKEKYDLVITDLEMERPWSGAEFALALRESQPNLPVILYSGQDSRHLADFAQGANLVYLVSIHVVKIEIETLRARVRQILERGF